MPERTSNCPKCKGKMEVGFTGDYNNRIWWVEGYPAFGWWGGLRDRESRQLLSIATYRCSNCGYLESYARAPPP